MLKAKFEDYLVNLFCDYFSCITSKDNKFHFICSDELKARELFFAFECFGFKQISISGVLINYITIESRHVLIMLHSETEGDKVCYSEDFIAKIRDELNSYPDFALFIIHNSTLDTILSTCKDLATKGGVYTPDYIKEDLLNKINSFDNKKLAEVLIERRVELIEKENRSVLGFRSLYEMLANKNILMVEEGLFDDPRLNDIDNTSEIKGDIRENECIFNKIQSIVNDYSENSKGLKDALCYIGFGEDFIKKYFEKNEKETWSSLGYREVINEIEKNKERNLELVEIKLNDEILNYWKPKSENKSNKNNISVLLELKRDNSHAELKIKFTRSEPVLYNESISITGDINKEKIKSTIINTRKYTILNCVIPVPEKSSFVHIKIKRHSSMEQFRFNCLIVNHDLFNLRENFSEIIIDSRNKYKVVYLENTLSKYSFNNEFDYEYIVDKQNDEVVCEKIGSIDFKDISEEYDNIKFRIIANGDELPIQVIGKSEIESIKLPGVLDPQRCHTIEQEDRIPQYKPLSRRVLISGQEMGLSVEGAKRCDIEHSYIYERILYKNNDKNKNIYIDHISDEYKEIRNAYNELFEWLKIKNTIISLTNWPVDFQNIASKIVDEYIKAFSRIEEGALSENERNLLKIGIFKEGGKEWMTPIHPLVLSYILQLLSIRREDEKFTFRDLADVTLQRLHPAGLIPLVFEENNGYAYSVPNSHNRLWIEWVPHQNNNYSYVAKLVEEKINDFSNCFSMLFDESNESSILVNSINNKDNSNIFDGIVKYFKRNKGGSRKINITLYDEEYNSTKFDSFNEATELPELRGLVRITESENLDTCDEVISLFRERLKYRKLIGKEEPKYSHISFFRNKEKVNFLEASVHSAKSGIASDGLLGGEASYFEHGTYYTGFGVKNLKKLNQLLMLSSYYNQLLTPARKISAQFKKNSVPVLAVNENFKKELRKSYLNSIWTCIIDPKVTLDFFNDEDTILIHYSDQYTSSISYDAITVTAKVALYKGLLKDDSDELINSFNAINGQWLLDIVKESGKPVKNNNYRQLKEKSGIVAAYKFLSAMFSKSDILWIPLSISEMLRVSGNIGLRIDDNDFSAKLNGYKKGSISDDLLFVGIKNNKIVLFPLEVKTRNQGNDFTKAVKQAKSLCEYMKGILSPKTFKGKLLRSMFIQQVYTQIDKYRLYSVFPDGYFDSVLNSREDLLQGCYDIVEMKNFALGAVISLNSTIESSRIDCDFENDSKILKIRIPHGLIKQLHRLSIQEWSARLTDDCLYPDLSNFILRNIELSDLEEAVTNNITESYLVELKENKNLNFSSLEQAVEVQRDYQNTFIKDNEEGTITISNDELIDSTEFSKKKEDLFDDFKNNPLNEIVDNNINDCRILLGESLDTREELYWEYGNSELANRHMIIFGRSGQGKTYCIQTILFELAKENINSLVIDYTNGFLPNHLESEFNEFVNPKTYFLANCPINISPFRKKKQDFGGIEIEEADHFVASRIASVFNKVYSTIGEQQLSTLSNVIEQGIKNFGEDFNFSSLLDLLQRENKTGETLSNKISPLIKSNLFDSNKDNCWNGFFTQEENRINIIQLASLSSDICRLATEFILWDLYSYACSYGNKNNPLPIVLDEVQNLDHRLESPLGKMLTEGRKYGFSLILATQTLSSLSKDEQDRIFQASHKLFFAPAETEAERYAKLLEQIVPGSNKKNWIHELTQLHKGECISVGLYKNSDGKLEQKAIKIKVSPLRNRLNGISHD
ncbi:DNA phosphorothioation-dependent restriction protein DptH [Xenorhabdus bovienii]|uniref:DNA phosphorothioation-dependent restriction protein DptH n=1 Tax=Xenorhabdus bovienii TaxID=40576 RepID=UPI0023B29B0C|nr:DNA phosphorothioation-dependent restriction protein DptH [Xenorhabdus bovienii]MDE9444774.1 DNA phosphorothioation-dependent restriction protein DptH [Xenorhabdus bovienii]